ncbi:unnamed protein product, partial [Mesorhabditis belari]|uniref:Uncharacterized protein n=1 Tax=Mesorhabditis belari TaxID=2138241 RepID=A0AAF3FRT2_9BILA
MLQSARLSMAAASGKPFRPLGAYIPQNQPSTSRSRDKPPPVPIHRAPSVYSIRNPSLHTARSHRSTGRSSVQKELV